MIRVLHLLSRSPDLHAAYLSEAVREGAGTGIEVHTQTIGRGGDYRNAAHAARAMGLGARGKYEVIHTCDMAALLATLATGARAVFSPSVAPSPTACARLAKAMKYRDVHITVSSETMRRKLIGHGIASGQCHTILPIIHPDDINRQRNSALREELGFSKNDIVLVAAGESVRTARHRLAVHAVSVLHVLDERYRILLWGRGKDANPAANLGPKVRQQRLVTVAEQKLNRPIKFEQLLTAADLALALGTDNAQTLPLALSMSAGLPIIAPATSASREFLADGATALLVQRPSPRTLAQSILELTENPAQMAKLGDAARVAAGRQFNSARGIAELLAVYRGGV